MITVQQKITFPDTYPFKRLGRLEDLLFFDIETTGFSGDYTQLYLIGCVYYQNDTWNLTQWFADTTSSEEEILHAFFHFLRSFRTVVHFNGDRFDIPYLQKRCRARNLPYNFDGICSIDIYKRIKPYRNLLKLEHLKQKSIEQFLGIFRQDVYNGGELIDLYKIYLQTHDENLYNALMLHNREDLEGMPLILPILNYPDFFEHPFLLKNEILSGEKLILRLESPVSLPIPCSIQTNLAQIDAEQFHLTIQIPLYHGCLKHFYPNYHDYYYLIYEDTAVHKSIGEFVERSARKKASAKNCYSKKSGVFLPVPANWKKTVFQTDYKEKQLYGEYDEGLFHNQTFLDQYIAYLLSISSK